MKHLNDDLSFMNCKVHWRWVNNSSVQFYRQQQHSTPHVHVNYKVRKIIIKHGEGIIHLPRVKNVFAAAAVTIASSPFSPVGCSNEKHSQPHRLPQSQESLPQQRKGSQQPAKGFDPVQMLLYTEKYKESVTCTGFNRISLKPWQFHHTHQQRQSNRHMLRPL